MISTFFQSTLLCAEESAEHVRRAVQRKDLRFVGHKGRVDLYQSANVLGSLALCELLQQIHRADGGKENMCCFVQRIFRKVAYKLLYRLKIVLVDHNDKNKMVYLFRWYKVDGFQCLQRFPLLGNVLNQRYTTSDHLIQLATGGDDAQAKVVQHEYFPFSFSQADADYFIEYFCGKMTTS